jgi:hypothetical protein
MQNTTMPYDTYLDHVETDEDGQETEYYKLTEHQWKYMIARLIRSIEEVPTYKKVPVKDKMLRYTDLVNRLILALRTFDVVSDKERDEIQKSYMERGTFGNS